MPFYKLYIHVLPLILLLFWRQPCTGADLGYQGTHILTHGTMEELAKAFYKKYGVRVFIKGGGCSDGIAAVVKNGFEMGGLCCPLPTHKAEKYNLFAYLAAKDVKAVIVNPKTGIANLTLEQISPYITKGAASGWTKKFLDFVLS